jgi:endonuclease/exonuclease/phosphatase (EEP) superfamily protein YafD
VWWILVAPTALWAVVRVLGLDGANPLVPFVAFTPYVALAALIPLAVTLAARRWWPAALAGLACLTLAACVLPRVLGPSSTMDGVPLRVMSANLRVGEADATAVVALIREQRVDVLAIQELTTPAWTALERAGIADLLPHAEVHPAGGVVGSALYSRFPLTDGSVKSNPGGFLQAVATVHIPGAEPIHVESVHPVPPATRASQSAWARGLRGQAPATVDGPMRVLVGDFNATLDHAELRRLLNTGYRDAASVVGKGLTPTWPYFGPRTAITPKVTIDHVLADPRIGVHSFEAFTIPRTDHRAILAELVLPASES